MLACTGDLPRDSYTVLKTVICPLLIRLTYLLHSERKTSWAWISGTLGILFNPILKVELQSDTWRLLDIVCAVLLLFFPLGVFVYQRLILLTSSKKFLRFYGHQFCSDTMRFLGYFWTSPYALLPVLVLVSMTMNIPVEYLLRSIFPGFLDTLPENQWRFLLLYAISLGLGVLALMRFLIWTVGARDRWENHVRAVKALYPDIE